MTDLSSEAVADAARYFDRWLAFRQRYERVPGVQAAVLHDDAVVLSCAHGLADVEAGTPLRPDHLFRIASHSKTFTATAVLQLAGFDALRLDDRVGDWLGFLVGSALEDVTIRELLAHGAGVVRDGWDGDFWQLFRAFPDRDELERISLDRASVLPRNERFKYSNIGYSLLGLVVEEVTEQPYDEYVAEWILDPLGLADTGPDLDPSRLGDYATGYSALSYADHRLPIEHIATGAMAPATGFFSTASDVVRYAAAHFHGDRRLLPDEAKRMMQRAEWAVEGTETSYGLGLSVSEIGKRRMLGHGGGFPGHITRTLFDPVDRLAVSVLTNAIDAPAEALATAAVRLVDLAQQGLDRPARARMSIDGVDLERWCGQFANLWRVFDVVALGGRLLAIDPTMADPAAEPQELAIVDERTLRFVDAPGYGSAGEVIVYDRADDGSVRSLRGGSGSTSYPLDDLAGALLGRDRVSLGDALSPSKPEPAPN